MMGTAKNGTEEVDISKKIDSAPKQLLSAPKSNIQQSRSRKRFQDIVSKVIKQNRAKKHKTGSCLTRYFFRDYNNLFKNEKIKEKELRPLPETFTSKQIIDHYDKIYKILVSKEMKQKAENKSIISVIIYD